MKILVFLLVLANLLFYAYSNDYLGQPERPDAERVARQIRPESVRIVSRGEEPPLSTAEERQEEIALRAAAEIASGTAAADRADWGCLLWDRLPAAEADRLGSLLGSRFPLFTAKRTDGGESGGWWIYIPPQANKAEADRKASELRQIGVTDYFVVQEGPNRFAISLGVFSGERGGQDRLTELKAKGVRSARLMPRPAKDGTISLQAKGPAADRAALLDTVIGSGLAKPLEQECL